MVQDTTWTGIGGIRQRCGRVPLSGVMMRMIMRMWRPIEIHIFTRTGMRMEGLSMTRVAAIYMPKGGVGKTFLAAHLSTGLAQIGRRVLVVDADVTQCQLALSFADLQRRGDTAALFMGDPGAPMKGLVQTPDGFPLLDVITGTPETSRTVPNWLRTSNPAFWVQTLKDRLQPLLGSYAYVIIDCGPGLDEVTQCVLHAANELWLPYRVDFKSVDSYLLLTQQILPQLRRSPDGFIRHVIPNLLTLGRRPRRGTGDREAEGEGVGVDLAHQARTNDARAVLSELQATFGRRLAPPVRMAEALALRSDGSGEVIWRHAPSSPVADDLAGVLEAIVAAEGLDSNDAA